MNEELAEIFSISYITRYHLQHEKIRPLSIEAYMKLELERSSADCFIITIMGYARSSFRVFESYFRIVIASDDDDIRLISKHSISHFITYELSPGIYSNKDISEAVYTMGDHGGTLKIEYDDIKLKTKIILTRFGSTFGTLRFDEKSFCKTLLGIINQQTPSWDYKPTNAIHSDSPVKHTMNNF